MSLNLKIPEHDPIRIGDINVGSSLRPKVIAEAGVAHFGSFEKLMRLVDMSAEAGADFFKMQHFDTEALVNPIDKEWSNRLKGKQVSNSFITRAKEYCDDKNIPFLCTAHDERSLDFLLNKQLVSAVKIGSGERGNFRMIDLACSSSLPLIISLGMYQERHILELSEYLSKRGKSDVIFLHCVTAYPVKPEDTNIAYIKFLKDNFPFQIGYSDHTEGLTFPLAAVVYGASIIEKHISVDFNVPNAQDWKVSLDGAGLKQLCKQIADLAAAIANTGSKGQSYSEKSSEGWALKSPYYNVDCATGDKFREEFFDMKRPYTGFSLKDAESYIGSTFKVKIRKGAAFSKKDF
jgi:N,N'-diacetyllegionaminate synthase